MADDNTKDHSLYEDVIKGVTVLGSTVREGIVDMHEGEFEKQDYVDIFQGRKETTPRDLLDSISKRHGIDLEMGGEHKTMTDEAVNLGTEILVDIFTSPDSLIGLPAKMLRASKAIKAISNPVARKAVERGVTGAVFGSLTMQPEDDMLDLAQAAATGALTFGVLPTALKGTAGAVNRAGTKLIDDAVAGISQQNREYFANLNIKIGQEIKAKLPERVVKSFSTALKEIKTLDKDTAPIRKLYQQEQLAVLEAYEQQLKAAGLNGEEIIKEGNKLRAAMAENSSTIVQKREAYTKAYKEAGHDKYDAHRLGTIQANEEVTKEFNKVMLEPMKGKMAQKSNAAMHGAINAFVDNNTKFADTYNQTVVRRSLDKFGRGSKAEKFVNEEMFVPIAYHTLDHKALDNTASAITKSAGNVATGVVKRADAEFMKNMNVTFREEIALASQSYASMYANTSQKQAGQLLSQVYKSAEDIRGQFGGRGILDIWTDSKISPSDKVAVGLDQYDKFIRLMKTKHLATGSSWLITNYMDNVMKAYVHQGTSTALKTAAAIPAGAAGAAVEALDTRFLGGLADTLTAGSISRFNKKNTFQKLIKAMDPTDLAPTHYDDAYLNGAALHGAIDSNRIIDLKKGINESNGIDGYKAALSGNSDEVTALALAAKNAAPKEFLPKVQDFFWNTVGRAGSTIEATARYITFKDIANSLDNTGAYNRVVKNKRMGFVVNDMPNLERLKNELEINKSILPKRKKIITRRIEEIEDVKDVFTRAATKTNDIFFDYDDVSTFENHVMKRIFPYWTFFSKNFQQWLEVGMDPDLVKRTAKLPRFATAVGDPLSEEMRAKTPDFLLEHGAKVVKDDNGDIKFAYSPNFSFFDVINTFQDPGGSFLGKLSQPLKNAGEIAVNREAFGRDIPVKPTDDKPVKRVLESALTLLPEELLEKADLFRNKDGKLYTNSENTALALKASQLLPIPSILDQAARFRRDRKFGDKSLAESALAFFPGLKTFEIGARQAEGIQARRERNKIKKEGGKEEVLGEGRSRKRRSRKRRRRRSRK